MSSRESSNLPRGVAATWCHCVSRTWSRLRGNPRRRAYLAAAAVPLLLLLWPWGVPARSGASTSARGPIPAALVSRSARLPSSITSSSAAGGTPGVHQRLTSLKGAPAAADRVPLVSAYTVQAGDTLVGIAARFGTDVASLEQINNLNASSILQIGQQLTVLDRVGWLYTVRPGDTASSIAASTGVSLSQLMSVNGLSGLDPILYPGERLVVPQEPTVAQPAGTGGGFSAGGLIWPVHGVITSPFGWRPTPWTGIGRQFHHGIDIGVPMHTPVVAACSGRVIVARWDGGYGEAVEIACDNGLITLYAHNSLLEVRYGEQVAQGNLLAYSGMTGNATGPHVHFGVMRAGVWQNPMNYLP